MLNLAEELTLPIIRNVGIYEQNQHQLIFAKKLRISEIDAGKFLLIRTHEFETAIVRQHCGYVHCHAGCSFQEFLFPALL